MSSLGEKIRMLRLSRGFTQEELAIALGLTKATISRYERGGREPSLELLEQIAATLGAEPYELLTPNNLILSNQLFWKEGSEATVPVGICKKYNIPLEAAHQIVDDVKSAYHDDFCTNHEKELREATSFLNSNGVQKVFEDAIRRAEELSEIPKYQKAKEPPQPE